MNKTPNHALHHPNRQDAIIGYTIFEILAVLMLLSGTIIIGASAYKHFGLLGAIVGVPIGACLGFLLVLASFRLLQFILTDRTGNLRTDSPPQKTDSRPDDRNA